MLLCELKNMGIAVHFFRKAEPTIQGQGASAQTQFTCFVDMLNKLACGYLSQRHSD
jgi:hypothetical protein